MTYHSNQKENISQNNNPQGFYQNGSAPPKGTKNTVIIVIVAVCCFALGVTVGVTGMIFKTKIVDNVMERINTSRPYITYRRQLATLNMFLASAALFL